MGAYRETHEDMAREAETRASFYRTLASLYFKELDQAGIDALSNEDLTATGVDDELMEEGYADMAAYLKHRDGGTRQELATDFAGAILAAGSYDDRRATPYESVFTSESGLLMQEARDDVYRRFCEARVAVDEGLRTPEDHLSFEFEFMAAQAGEAGALTALYFFSVGGQLLRGVPKRKRPREEERQVEEPRARAETETEGEAMPSEMLAYCRKLALENGLTPREAEILGLIAMGRSAKYIAEELTISHNTTRTHIKHVYEKLNIHSKQELLDLVLFGSGLM